MKLLCKIFHGSPHMFLIPTNYDTSHLSVVSLTVISIYGKVYVVEHVILLSKIPGKMYENTYSFDLIIR